MCKVRWECRLEAGCGYGEGDSDSLEARRNWARQCMNPGVGCLHILLRPLRIAVSRVATNSVMTWSASCRPASTEMMSELGLVYFLPRAASRKTVKVYAVSP